MGTELMISLEAMKVEVGLGGSILCQSYRKFGCLATKSLVEHTWGFLEEFSMTIEDKVGELKLRRQGDVYLTELFRSNGIKGKALQEMNDVNSIFK